MSADAWRKVLLRDPCAYCGAPAAHVDHIVPSSDGGAHDPANYTAACSPCNLSKSDRPLLHFLLIRVDADYREHWRREVQARCIRNPPKAWPGRILAEDLERQEAA